MFGRILDGPSEQELSKLNLQMMETINPIGPGSEIDMFPWLRYFPYKAQRELQDLRDHYTTWITRERTITQVHLMALRKNHMLSVFSLGP